MTGVQTCALPISRERLGGTDIAIVRVERLYPLPAAELAAVLAEFPADAELCWVQDEPANQGPWPFMALNLPAALGGRPLRAITRAASSSPAVGSAKLHEREQIALIETAFG